MINEAAIAYRTVKNHSAKANKTVTANLDRSVHNAAVREGGIITYHCLCICQGVDYYIILDIAAVSYYYHGVRLISTDA